ncbi:MAG: crossover junction endodeoxyribonuclease RuvC [Leptospirales bacterium]
MASGGGARPSPTASSRRVSVMGVDPGLARTGWAVVSGESFQRLSFDAGGTIRTLPGHPLHERIGAICDEIEAAILAHGISALAVEDHFSRRNAPGVGHLLGPVIGAIALLAFRNRLSFLLIPPRELKHRVTGTGGADKESLIRALSFWFGTGLEIRTTHEGDALGLAFLGFGRLDRP